MIDVQPSGRTRIVAASLLWAFWVVSILPVVALFFEFGNGQLGACGDEWKYHATFYSHFFIYPVTFGLVSTAFLHRPWIQVVHYLRSLPEPARTKKTRLIVISMLVVVGFMSAVEFIRLPQGSASEKCGLAGSTEAARALWDFAPDAMKGEAGERIRALVAKQCREARPLSFEEKCEFGEEMGALWEAGDGRSPRTVQFYRAGFVTMTFIFVFLFAAIAVVRTWESKIRNGPEGKRIAERLLLALLFAASWVLMRIAYLQEKSSIYPEDPELTFDVLIFITFLIFFLHGAASRWTIIARHDEFLRRAIFIVGVATPFTIRFVSDFHPETGMGDFLVHGLLLTLGAGLLFKYCISFPFLLKRLV